jgi:hypothetical protein
LKSFIICRSCEKHNAKSENQKLNRAVRRFIISCVSLALTLPASCSGPTVGCWVERAGLQSTPASQQPSQSALGEIPQSGSRPRSARSQEDECGVEDRKLWTFRLFWKRGLSNVKAVKPSAVSEFPPFENIGQGFAEALFYYFGVAYNINQPRSGWKFNSTENFHDT